MYVRCRGVFVDCGEVCTYVRMNVHVHTFICAVDGIQSKKRKKAEENDEKKKKETTKQTKRDRFVFAILYISIRTRVRTYMYVYASVYAWDVQVGLVSGVWAGRDDGSQI